MHARRRSRASQKHSHSGDQLGSTTTAWLGKITATASNCHTAFAPMREGVPLAQTAWVHLHSNPVLNPMHLATELLLPAGTINGSAHSSKTTARVLNP
jgi:hypothetical protein